MGTEFQSPSSVMLPPSGAAIFSVDGEQFASVRDARAGYFQLDIPMGRDFWLSTQYIDSIEGTHVRLNISKDEADEHRLEAPGLDAEEDPHVATGDTVISDEQALTQRERMERELQMQRERMEREKGDWLDE